MEVLDTLRALRQTQEVNGLRMVLTGSIGLHHVLDALKDQGYKSSPVNDTLAIQVPALDPGSGRDLAAKLLDGEDIRTDSRDEVAEAIAEQSDRFPFYIHHVAKALKQRGAPVTTQVVRETVTRHLRDPDDPWELSHYRDRIPLYYGPARESAVLGILDGIAARSGSVALDELLSELKSTGTLDDRETLLRLLRRIEQDHYLSRGDEGHYRFQFPLLERWWKLSRAL